VKWINHIRYEFKVKYKSLHDQLIKECNECTCFKNHVFCMFSCPSEIQCDPVGRFPESIKIFRLQKKVVRIIGKVGKHFLAEIFLKI
jgi:hypothetical protein